MFCRVFSFPVIVHVCNICEDLNHLTPLSMLSVTLFNETSQYDADHLGLFRVPRCWS